MISHLARRVEALEAMQKAPGRTFVLFDEGGGVSFDERLAAFRAEHSVDPTADHIVAIRWRDPTDADPTFNSTNLEPG